MLYLLCIECYFCEDHLRETFYIYIYLCVYVCQSLDLENNFGNGLEIVERLSEVASCYFCWISSDTVHFSFFPSLFSKGGSRFRWWFAESKFSRILGYILLEWINESIIARWLFRDGMRIVLLFYANANIEISDDCINEFPREFSDGRVIIRVSELHWFHRLRM